MAFRFSLAPLLHLRQSIEHQRALRLQEANLNVSRVKEMLLRLGQFLANAAESDEASFDSGRRGSEIQFAANCRERLRELEAILRTDLDDLEARQRIAATQYQQAYSDREALEVLRSRQRAEYRRDQVRREQRELDATHLLQLWRNRTG